MRSGRRRCRIRRMLVRRKGRNQCRLIRSHLNRLIRLASRLWGSRRRKYPRHRQLPGRFMAKTNNSCPHPKDNKYSTNKCPQSKPSPNKDPSPNHNSPNSAPDFPKAPPQASPLNSVPHHYKSQNSNTNQQQATPSPSLQ